MTDTQFKHTPLDALSPGDASTHILRPNTVMTEGASRAVAAAQDTVVAASRRVLGTWGLDGSDAFSVPAIGLQAVGAQTHPDRDNAREAGSIFCDRLTPGCFVAVRIVYVGSGSTAVENPPATWNPGGPGGAIDLEHSWTSGVSTSGPTEIKTALEASLVADSAIPNVQAGFWHELRSIDLAQFQPLGIGDPAVGVLWVEDVELDLAVRLRGSPRVVAVVVYEEPVRAVYEHDDVGPHSVNGQVGIEVRQTEVPQVEAADGVTYEEHRFGTHQLLRTAAQQQRSVGPVLAQMTSWHEGDQDPLTDLEPIEITSLTFVDIYEPLVTAYDRERAGFISAGSQALVHYLDDPQLIIPGGVAALVPGRVVVVARVIGGGVIGVVRIQSGLYEWIDVTVTSQVLVKHVVTGYFESQVVADHAFATIQVFGKVDATTLEITAVAATFGE